MSGLDFTIYCGRCFAVVTPQRGGSVLSCGDFLCSPCAQQLLSGSSCPSCGRNGVRAAFLNDSLPEEVKVNIADPTKHLETMFQVLGFQTKYYKAVIRKLVSRLQDSDQEINKKNICIRDLEAMIASQQRSQPFFSKEAVATTMMEEDPYCTNERVGQKGTSSFFHQDPAISTSESYHPQSNRSAYFDPTSAEQQQRHHVGPLTQVHEPSPRINRSNGVEGSNLLPPSINSKTTSYPTSNAYDMNDIPTYHQGFRNIDPPEHELPRDHRRSSIEQLPFGHEVPAAYRGATNKEDIHQERKRVFTPSRTIFSSAQKRGSVTSPKIRSANEPYVSSPSQNAFNPLKTGRVVEMYRVNHQQTETRTSFSPMSSFLRSSSYKS